MFTLEELETKDIIEVDSDTIKNAMEYFKNIKINNNGYIHLDINFFIIEGVQKCFNTDNSIVYIYFKIDENNKKGHIEVYLKTKNQFDYIGSNKINFKMQDDYGYKFNKRLQQRLGTKKLKEIMQYHVGMFIEIFQYLTNIIDNRKTIVKEVKLNNRTKKSYNNIKVDKSTTKKVINLSNDNVKYKLTINDEVANNLIKRTYTRHIETWQVRGFERHYKSGKVVYVKPFIKGNKNGKTENKVYKI